MNTKGIRRAKRAGGKSWDTSAFSQPPFELLRMEGLAKVTHWKPFVRGRGNTKGIRRAKRAGGRFFPAVFARPGARGGLWLRIAALFGIPALPRAPSSLLGSFLLPAGQFPALPRAEPCKNSFTFRAYIRPPRNAWFFGGPAAKPRLPAPADIRDSGITGMEKR